MAVELIINADDFGMSEGISRGILEAHDAGIVTSCSMMVNVVPGDEVEALRNRPGLGVGIHLNLTGGPAMSSVHLGNLTDEYGNFIREHRFGFDGVEEEHIRAELKAQVNSALNLGIANIDHIDSHCHIQRHRVVFDTMKDLAVEKGLGFRASDPWMVDELRQAGVWCNDWFIEEFYEMENLNVGSLISMINNLEEGVTELMCHPGHLIGEPRLPTGHLEERPVELRTILDPKVIDTINEKGVKLRRFAR